MPLSISETEEHSLRAAAESWATLRSMNACPRCGGLMVTEWGGNPISNTGQRCVQCGELIDLVVLFNRRLHPPGTVRSSKKDRPAAHASATQLRQKELT